MSSGSDCCQLAPWHISLPFGPAECVNRVAVVAPTVSPPPVGRLVLVIGVQYRGPCIALGALTFSLPAQPSWSRPRAGTAAARRHRPSHRPRRLPLRGRRFAGCAQGSRGRHGERPADLPVRAIWTSPSRPCRHNTATCRSAVSTRRCSYRLIDSKLVVADGKHRTRVDVVGFQGKREWPSSRSQVIEDFWLQKELSKRVTPEASCRRATRRS